MDRARTSDRSETRCPYCHDAVRANDAGAVRCRACAAPHHGPCWREHAGCATCGAADAQDDGSFVIVSRKRAESGRIGPVPEGAGTPRATPASRVEALEEGEALVLRRRLPRALPAAAFMAVWLCGWLLGEVFALGALGAVLFAGGLAEALCAGGFLSVWLAFWTLGGLAAIGAFLTALGSEERLEVGRDEVVLRHVGPAGLPTGWTRRARRADVLGVDVDGNTVVVEHGGGSIRWQLTPDEATWVKDRLRSQLGLAERKG